MLSTLLALAVANVAPQQPTRVDEPRHLVQVHVRDAAALRTLERLDLDLAGCGSREPAVKVVDVIAYERDLATLTAAGLPFEVAIRDLQRHHAAEAARNGALAVPTTLTPPLGQGAMGGHWTLAQVEAILDSFANDYPTICTRKVSIGRTIEGRDIWMVKISDNPNSDEGEPEVLFDALHHAREPLSMEATVLFMDRLLTGYGTDPEATFLVNERELFFVPLLNPDGYEHNRQTNPGGGGMWRKNRRVNGGGTFGVDLNRNYATGWSAPNGGNSTSPSSDTYRGTAPFSEPETTALEAFCATRQFVQVFSTHTYTDVLLRPWGYQNGDPANAGEYDRIGALATATNGLQHGNTAGLLYIAAGGALDHHHVVRGAYGWTAELGRQNEGGFWPSGTTINAIAERHQQMFRAIAATSGAFGRVGARTITDGPGSNQNGAVEPGETGLLTFTLVNDGAGAYPADAIATLTAVTPGIGIAAGTANLGRPLKFQSVTTATPLAFTVPAGFAAPVATLRLTVVGDGRTLVEDVRVVIGGMRLAVDDDMERDRGFRRVTPGSATLGLWERAAPQQTVNGGTVIQPGSDRSPVGTMCQVTDARAGSGAGSYDVDGGVTELLSPRLALAHCGVASVSFWYWYAESVGNDAFVVEASDDDGGRWFPLLSRSTSTGAWVQFDAELPFAPTDAVRVRFRAQDLNASLVEALVDDFEVRGAFADGSLALLSSGDRGSDFRLGVAGRAAATVAPFVSLGVGDLALPGITGRLLLDPARLYALPSFALPTSGFAAFDAPIPLDASLVGATFHFQAAHFDGTTLRLGNRQSLSVR